MTWNVASWSGAVHRLLHVLCVAALLGAIGCSGGNKSKTLTVTEPAADAVLTSDDDADDATPGLQYEVLAEATGLSVGTEVELVVGDTVVMPSEVTTGGNVTFSGATLPPGVNRIAVRTVDLAVSSDPDQEYSFRLLEIVSPAPGDVEDADPSTAGVQVNVVVKAYGILSNVELLVDGESAGSEAPDSDETVSFVATLSVGDNTLVATTEGDVSSEPVVVTASGAGGGQCRANLVSPAVPAGADSISLGGSSCPEGAAPFRTDLTIATGAGDGTAVVLKTEAGTVVASTTVDGAVAVFEDVVLDTGANKLVFDIADVGGCETPLGVDIIVDCAGPSCAITTPVPENYMGVDYVNGSMLDGSGRVLVDVTTSAVGEPVQLTVDGANPIVATAGADGVASFQLLLGDADHTVTATCGADGKPQRSTDELDWTVDTVGCPVEITAPTGPGGADYVYVAGDTTQLTATVTGADCVHVRVAACDPGDGIDAAVDWADWDGSGDFDPVFDAVQGPQTQCVEIRDRAKNVELGTLAIDYYPTAPMVSLLTPADDLSVNLDGGGGYTVSPVSGFCQTDFRVQCSAIGTPVELFRMGGVDPFATGDCEEPGAGDGDVQAGFGVATFAAQQYQRTPLNATNTIFAVQTFEGTTQNLVGSTMAQPLIVQSDCQRPMYAINGDCGDGVAQDIAGNPFVFTNFQVGIEADAHRPDTIELELVSQNGNALPGGMTYTGTYNGNRFAFGDVELGTLADVITLRIATPDTFDNAPEADVPGRTLCTVTITADPPSFTQPLSVATNWLPNDNDGACPSPVNSHYDVPVEIGVDNTDPAARTLEYQVDGGAATALPIAGALATYCIPVPDDDATHDIKVTLRSADGGVAQDQATGILVSSLEIADPTGGSISVSDDTGACASPPSLQPNQLAVEVVSLVDGVHAGDELVASQGANMASATVPGGCGGSCLVATCLAVDAGASSTIAVGITGKAAQDSVVVAVSPAAPANAIANLSATLPAADDPDYREGQIVFDWDAPIDLLGSYELRCSETELMGGDDPDAWWDAADSYSISATPPETTGTAQMGIGISRHCLLRGLDYISRQTPAGATSTPVHFHFRRQVVEAASPTAFGGLVRPAGDLDEDGADDFLVNASGETYVYYGRDQAAGALAAQPQADVFAESGGQFFGFASASVGDVSGDDVLDLGFTELSAFGYRGAAYLVYGGGGRLPAATGLGVTYDAMMDVYTCTGASVCLVDDRDPNADFLGWSMVAAGDFDNDGVADIAVGAQSHLDGGTKVGRVYVLSGAGLCATPGCTMRLPTDDPDGFIIDGVSGTATYVGQAIAGGGDIDGDGKADLVIAARGISPVPAQVRYLSGRAFGSGLVTVDWSSLPLVGGAAETALSYGLSLAFSANAMDTTEAGVPDLLVSDRSASRVFIYAGDDDAGQRFASATRIAITGLTGDANYGIPLAASLHPTAGEMADLDGDGVAEIVVGSMSGGPGEAFLIFGSELAASCGGGTCAIGTVGRPLQWVDPATPVPTAVEGYTVGMGGDLTGDGHVDYLVGDKTAANGGRVTVLY